MVRLTDTQQQIILLLQSQLPDNGACASEDELRVAITSISRVLNEGQHAVNGVVQSTSTQVSQYDARLASTMTQNTLTSVVRVVFQGDNQMTEICPTQPFSMHRGAGALDEDSEINTVVIPSTAD